MGSALSALNAIIRPHQRPFPKIKCYFGDEKMDIYELIKSQDDISVNKKSKLIVRFLVALIFSITGLYVFNTCENPIVGFFTFFFLSLLGLAFIYMGDDPMPSSEEIISIIEKTNDIAIIEYIKKLLIREGRISYKDLRKINIIMDKREAREKEKKRKEKIISKLNAAPKKTRDDD
ncbi:hypothetical protein HLB25_10250 [Dickeya dadantii]|uniref:hypothetical protein n=1 Tax=Dickeya dadantii TaxID=204038 RepID=UPI001495B65F|nr:hypothetical protein [Dickeya dadantii]NPE55890.1 hypothetical protein [Dickeya dadantii]NPE67114.1 hypothetical protein [Dickeya dadantii]